MDKLDSTDHVNIKKEIGKDGRHYLDALKENDPSECDSVGTLISKLACVTTQMWSNQEVLYAIRFMDTDEFIKQYDNNLKELHMTIKRCCDLNVQRANLMDAIDKVAAKNVQIS